MNELEDIKLRAILHELQLEKPASNFSVRVMERILQEDSAMEKIKSERILGKGFWIITILFVVLLVVVFLVSNLGMGTETQLPLLVTKFQNGVNSGYQTFFQKMDSAPLSIAGILIASSILIFIDRFINSNIKVFS
jgi:hypothetical protein